MAARYDLYENPDPQKSGEQQPMHARFFPFGKISADELYRLAADGTTFNPHELASAFKLITDTIVRQLERGNIIELGDMGTISMTLECRPVMEKTEIRSASIHVKNLTLRTSKAMKQRIKGIELERNPFAWKSVEMNTQTRDRKLTEFFAQTPIMTRRDYEKLRACKPGKALEEINQLIAEGRIKRQGIRSSSFYLPTEGNFGK